MENKDNDSANINNDYINNYRNYSPIVQQFMLNFLSGNKDINVFYNNERVIVNDLFDSAKLIKRLPEHIINRKDKRDVLRELADLIYDYDNKNSTAYNIIGWCINVKYNNDYILTKYVNGYKINKYHKICNVYNLTMNEQLRRAMLENYFYNSYNVRDLVNWLKGQRSNYDELRIAVINRRMQKNFIKELNRLLGNSKKQYEIFCNMGWVVPKANYDDKSLPTGQRKIYTIDDFYMNLPEEYQLGIFL